MTFEEDQSTIDPYDGSNINIHNIFIMSLVMRKPDFCICKNKDADQLRGSREVSFAVAATLISAFVFAA